jgi:hypothetical protein
MRRTIYALIVLAFSCAAISPLHALEFVRPLPDHVKKPLGAFLAASGWKSAERLVSAAKYSQLTEQLFLIRVADPAACDSDGDLCLTIIGSTRSGGFVSEVVFYAGAKFEAANNSFPLGGKEGPSLFFVRFYGKKQGVTAMPAPTGWIVIPTGTINDFKGPTK